MIKDQLTLNEYDVVVHKDNLEKIKKELYVLYESLLPNDLVYLNVYTENEDVLILLKKNNDIMSYKKTDLFTLE